MTAAYLNNLQEDSLLQEAESKVDFRSALKALRDNMAKLEATIGAFNKLLDAQPPANSKTGYVMPIVLDLGDGAKLSLEGASAADRSNIVNALLEHAFNRIKTKLLPAVSDAAQHAELLARSLTIDTV